MIRIHIDRELAARSMSILELSRRGGLHYGSLHALVTGKAKRLDVATLDAICTALGVGVGDILEHVPEHQP